MIHRDVLEGIARAVHDETGIEPPIDAFVLAELCGVEVYATGGSSARGDVVRRAVWVGSRPRHVRRNGLCMHEVAHVLLYDEALDYLDEAAARYLTGALMLPREHFLRDIATTDYDLFELERIHTNASAEMIVVRITQVSPATAAVWDAGKLTRDYGRGAVDRELVDEVLVTERPVRDGNVLAWPKFDGRERRVIVIGRAA